MMGAHWFRRSAEKSCSRRGKPEEKFRLASVESRVPLTNGKAEIGKGEKDADSTGLPQANKAALNRIDGMLVVN